MRVRPQRNLTRRPLRRTHAGPVREAAAEQPAPPADEHPHERRARESGGPIDNAHYTCGCGLAFDAPVSTTVACPHCGAGQAW